MPIDPFAARYLQRLAATTTIVAPTLQEQRRQAEEVALAQAGVPEAVASVSDRTIAGPGGAVPLRIYTPLRVAVGPLPILVYFHSGGWVFGSINAHDPVCRALANRVRCLVVSVGYRLAPEHRFPAAPEDCYTAARWVAEHAQDYDGDAGRLAVGGDSAGGNLAAAVTLMARDRRGPSLCFQVLIYPETCYYDPQMESYRLYADGYGLTRDEMLWYWDQYLARPEDRLNPYASPLYASDLSGLPPALIVTAEYDPVRDEAEQYAERLRQAGVSVQCIRYAGMIHSFFRMFALFEQSHHALLAVAEALRVGFAAPG